MNRIFKALLASTTFIAGTAAALSAAALPSGQLPFDPKPSLAVKGAQLRLDHLGIKDGYTDCDTDGWCIIPAMPILYQTDPDVQKALATAMTDYIKIYFVQDPKATDSATGKACPPGLAPAAIIPLRTKPSWKRMSDAH